MRVILTESIICKAKLFAEQSVDSSADRYARRNQSNIEKIKKDIFIGRVGEEVTHLALKDKLPNLSAPDYNIYDAGSKSWDSDLTSGELKLAVKSQDVMSGFEYGISWIFQFNENKNYDCDKEIFKSVSENQYVSCVSVNVQKKIADILAIVKVSWLHENALFKDPQKESLKGHKLAVYFDDMQSTNQKLFQLNAVTI